MFTDISNITCGDDPVIIVEDLIKHFRIRLDGDDFRERVRLFFRPEYRTVKALDGVSFTVRRGESVGYIGLNGAGKSTLSAALRRAGTYIGKSDCCGY